MTRYRLSCDLPAILVQQLPTVLKAPLITLPLILGDNKETTYGWEDVLSVGVTPDDPPVVHNVAVEGRPVGSPANGGCQTGYW